MHRPNLCRLFGFLLLAPSLLRAHAGTDFFESKIRPILVDACYSCHSAEAKKLKGDLHLDSREGLLTGGATGPSIIPGDPDKSVLIKAVRYKDEDLQMPPKKKLADEQIAALEQWVKMGAPDPRIAAVKKGVDFEKAKSHWAFQPLKQTAIPNPRTIIPGWPRTDIDRFILAKLADAKIHPNPLASKQKLIRRAYYDLLGLPPSPDELAAFLNDNSPTAYESMIDRLLANPHYGERYARHWLDLARFAESHGYEQDYDRPNAYHYRDFVIKALNDDLPYNTFVKWQIAGDEIAPSNPEAMKATGYLAAGTHATQITANQAEKERYDELDDMAATVGTSMLALTVGCARCHDHKFDPIPTKDYYRLISTFTTTVRSDLPLNLNPEQYQQAKQEFDAAHAPLVSALAAYEKETLPASFAQWLRSPSPGTPGEGRPTWLTLTPDSLKSQGNANFTPQGDGSFLASGARPTHDVYTFTAHTPLRNITAIKLEALSHPSLVKGGPGRADNGNFALSDFSVTASPLGSKDAPLKLKLQNPKSTFDQKGLPITATIDADGTSAWAVDPQFGKDHAATYELETPLDFPTGATLTFTLKFQNNAGHSIGRPRISISNAPLPAKLDAPQGPHNIVEVAAILNKPADQRTDADRATLLSHFKTLDPEYKRLQSAITDHLKKQPQPSLVKVLVSSEGVPAVRLHTQGPDFYEKTFFLKRGDLNQRQEEAPAGFLSILTRAPESTWQQIPPKDSKLSLRRTALANWITDTDHGAGILLARVIVNRLWQHHFGRPIVATPSDFGLAGDPPSHPELLDYLASELIKNNWQLKKLHRLIMTSSVYMQSSEYDDARASIDIDNRLCWRRPHLRLESEPIRDAMLTSASQLDPTMFGPGTLDEGMKRRSIYFFQKRSQLIPLMTLFDAPNTLQGMSSRPTTTVAPQALAMLNNPHIRAYAKSFAQRLLPLAQKSPEEAVKLAYLIALSRNPDPQELKDALDFLSQSTPLDSALADFCQTLFCLNEFVYVD